MLLPEKTLRTAAPPFRRGFSLIELMIVIAILGALVAIIIPSFAYSEHSAKTDVAISEMRQIREAFARFHRDNYPSHAALKALGGYGLWTLFTTNGLPDELIAVIHEIGGYDSANRLGWRGPYALMEGHPVTVRPLNGQPQNDKDAGWGSGAKVTIPVIRDPHGGFYRVMESVATETRANEADLYIVCTGPDRQLNTHHTSTNGFGDLEALADDVALPLSKP